MKFKLCFILTTCLFFFNSVKAQNWTLTEAYEFHASDQSSHDATWNIGAPWWTQDACGIGTCCSGWHYGLAYIGNELSANNLTPVSGGLNNNIKYANVTTSSGTHDCIRFIASKELNYPYPPCTLDPQFNYKSGEIFSKNSYLYGKYEIKCKIPNQKGVMVAFWLIDPDMQYGEIDVMELVNGQYNDAPTGTPPPVMGNNIHSWGPIAPNPSRWDNGINYFPTADLSDDFHVYALEWSPFYLKYSLDGTTTWMLSPTGQPYFPNGPMKLVVGIGVNGYYPTDAAADYDMSQTPSEVSLDVDYIKIYTEQCSSYVLCNSDVKSTISNSYDVDLAIPNDVDYDGNDEVPSGSSITCDKTVTNSAPLSVTAANLITMHPGFSADATGSSSVIYTAQIAACNGEQNNNKVANNISTPPIAINDTPTDFSVYPNPANTLITITSKQSIHRVEILNMTGQVMLSKTGDANFLNLDIESLSNGIYFVKVHDELNSANVKKLVIQK